MAPVSGRVMAAGRGQWPARREADSVGLRVERDEEQGAQGFLVSSQEGSEGQHFTLGRLGGGVQGEVGDYIPDPLRTCCRL